MVSEMMLNHVYFLKSFISYLRVLDDVFRSYLSTPIISRSALIPLLTQLCDPFKKSRSICAAQRFLMCGHHWSMVDLAGTMPL